MSKYINKAQCECLLELLNKHIKETEKKAEERRPVVNGVVMMGLAYFKEEGEYVNPENALRFLGELKNRLIERIGFKDTDY